jgi:hypothetical protein
MNYFFMFYTNILKLSKIKKKLINFFQVKIIFEKHLKTKIKTISNIILN